MTSFFQRQPEIQAEIISIITTNKKTFSSFAFDEAQFDHLEQVATKGKQFRGCLLVALYESLGGKNSPVAIRLAAAVELYGTALLIHDDIMDRSDTRRGFPATYKHFETEAKKLQLSDPTQFGLSAAISLGDVLFFLAESTIYSLDLPSETILQLSKLCSKELLLLGLAQVEDMRVAFTSEIVTRETILKMYAGKTGRYTGMWPVQLATTLMKLDSTSSKSLGIIGEKIGVLFQIKDDELGIFGDEKLMGKSATSDITEGKKTLYYLFLQEQLSDQEKQKVFSIIGNAQASKEEVDFVKTNIEKLGIADEVQAYMTKEKDLVLRDIEVLDIPVSAKSLLKEVLEMVIHREK